MGRVLVYHTQVLEYENSELQEKARKVMPVEKLRQQADEAMRTGPEKDENGEPKLDGRHTELRFLCADAALAWELLVWFRGEFFSWVDALKCWACDGDCKVRVEDFGDS